MHYGIPSHLTNLSPGWPAYGLVEATTDTTYQTVNSQMLNTLTALSVAFRNWGNRHVGTNCLVPWCLTAHHPSRDGY
jgi:hypothetical protein